MAREGTKVLTEPLVLFDGNCLNPTPDQTRRPRGRPRLTESVDRMDGILTTALDLFAELGFGGVSIDAVAKRARISKETLYQLFPGKPALFQAVLENQIRKWVELERKSRPMKKAATLREGLEQLLDLMLRASASPQFTVVARLIQGEAFRFPELAAVLREHGTERGVAACADLITCYAEADKIPCRNATDVARLMVGSLDTLRLDAALRRHTITDEERSIWIGRTLDIFIAGRSAW